MIAGAGSLLAGVALAGVSPAVASNPAPIPAAPYSGAPSTIGTEFWGVFSANVNNEYPDYIYLSDTTSKTVQATVAVPGYSPPFSANVTVIPGKTTSVELPLPAPDASQSDGIDNTGVHVTASGPVSVYGLDDWPQSTDGWTGLPVTGIGKSYTGDYLVNGVSGGVQ